jgi:hypothetical protein
MSRIGVPTGDSVSVAEARRRRKAAEAFERRCAEAAKQIEHITVPVLVDALTDPVPNVRAAAAEAFENARVAAVSRGDTG